MNGWTTLVQAETLAIALGRSDLVVVDCRFALANPTGGQSAYLVGHIPGAVYAHLDQDLSDHRKRGQGRHPWPESADFTARLSRWGISPKHQVVAYDDGDGAYASRFWFLLKALGHEKVAVLDGGLDMAGMISHRAPLSRAPELFAEIAARQLTHRKIVFDPSS